MCLLNYHFFRPKAHAKILKELPSKALCIDYTSGLVEILGDPLVVVETRVSWNENQKIYVFAKP